MDLSTQILAQILIYGPVVLGIVVFLAAIGVPFPSSVVVIACGAFIEQGFLEGVATLGTALIFVVTGDGISYLMGYTGRRITRRFINSPTWSRADAYFQRRGSIAIFLTRCLLTPLAVPTNLIAGGSHFPVLRFLSLSVAGEFIWLVSYGALGYAFGSQWEYISDFVSNFSGVLVGIVMLSAGVYWMLRHPPKIIRQFRHKGDIQASDETFSSLQ